MKSNVLLSFIVLLTTTSVLSAEKSKFTDIYELGFDDLTKLIVTTPSKRTEPISEAPSVVTVVTAKEIELFGALDLQEILDRVLGVQSFNAPDVGRNYVGIRSDVAKPADNSHVLMLLNGTPFNRESWNQGIWAQAGLVGIPVQMIDRIEVIRGPGSVLHGAKAFQGVINIITKKATENEISATVGYGSWDTEITETFWNIKQGDLQISAALSYVHTDGWERNINGVVSKLSADSHEENLGVLITLNYRNFYTNIWYATTEQSTVRININTPAEGFLHNDHYFIDSGYEFNITDDWTLKGKVSTGGHRTDFAFLGNALADVGFIAEFKIDDSLFELNAEGPVGEKGKLLIGGVVNYLTGEYPRGGVPSWYDTSYSFYTQFDYHLNDDVKFIAGGQYNNTDITDIFVPRLGLIYSFTEDWGMKLLYGEAFRAPATGETNIDVPAFSIRGNNTLDFELVKTYDLQFYYNTKKTQTSLTFFHNKQKDLINRAIINGISTWENKDELTIRGIEFESKHILVSGWYISGGLTYQENKSGDGVDDFTHMPDVEAKLGIYYDSKTFSFGIFDSYTSAYKKVKDPAFVDVHPDSKDYHDISANITFKLHEILNWNSDRKLSLDFHATNLLDDVVYRTFPQDILLKSNTAQTDADAFYSVKLRYTF